MKWYDLEKDFLKLYAITIYDVYALYLIGIIFYPINKMVFFIISGAWIKILCALFRVFKCHGYNHVCFAITAKYSANFSILLCNYLILFVIW